MPYLDARMEYPVLTGLLIWSSTRAGPMPCSAADVGRSRRSCFVVSLANTVLALAVTRMLWGWSCASSRLWAWALAPLLVLYVGHNWDMLAVALALGAFVAAERGMPVRACALAALGTAAKLFPVLLLPLFALRRLLDGRIAEVVVLASAAIGAWLVVNVPVALAAPGKLVRILPASPRSAPAPAPRCGTSAAITVLIPTGIAEPQHALAADVRRRAGRDPRGRAGSAHKDRLWLLFTPVLLWFMLSSKVYSPQFDLWAWPLHADHRAPLAAGRAVRRWGTSPPTSPRCGISPAGGRLAGDADVGDPGCGFGARRRDAVADRRCAARAAAGLGSSGACQTGRESLHDSYDPAQPRYPHGGGPCFFMPDPNGTWTKMEAYLQGPRRQPARAAQGDPDHLWPLGRAGFAFTGAEQPELLFDYYNFPPETYQLTWPAPGAPWLAERGVELLKAAGLPVAGIHPSRGYDHGVFMPDEGRLSGGHDPHDPDVDGRGARSGAACRGGQALAPLRDEGVLILGSGISFHNLRVYGDPRVEAPSLEFDG